VSNLNEKFLYREGKSNLHSFSTQSIYYSIIMQHVDILLDSSDSKHVVFVTDIVEHAISKEGTL
jgi:hypothetical protein